MGGFMAPGSFAGRLISLLGLPPRQSGTAMFEYNFTPHLCTHRNVETWFTCDLLAGRAPGAFAGCRRQSMGRMQLRVLVCGTTCSHVSHFHIVFQATCWRAAHRAPLPAAWWPLMHACSGVRRGRW